MVSSVEEILHPDNLLLQFYMEYQSLILFINTGRANSFIGRGTHALTCTNMNVWVAELPREKKEKFGL